MEVAEFHEHRMENWITKTYRAHLLFAFPPLQQTTNRELPLNEAKRYIATFG